MPKWILYSLMALFHCSFLYSLSSVDSGLQRWNKVIKRRVSQGNPDQAILAYVEMKRVGFDADNFTFPVLLKAASSLSSCCIGFALHGQAMKTGFSGHCFVGTALLDMYSAFGAIDHATKVFEEMGVKDVVVWNSMLAAYASCGQMDNAMKLFDNMPLKDLASFNIMISGYAKIGKKAAARSIFDRIHAKDIVSWNSMILACTNVGDMGNARNLFDVMPKKNVITWNTMISGYLHAQLYAEAVDLFDEMKAGNHEADHLTVTLVLSACAHLGWLGKGTEMHVYAQDHRLASSPHVATSLIDMYAKCGTIQRSLEVFYKSQVKDIYCWNAIISGLALHGYGHAAVKLLDKMRDNGVRPDEITFIGLLSACSHRSLVQEGCRLFDCMEKEFGLPPKLEHYGCMVDLLGRAGFLDPAFQLIKAMPFEPGESILGALLGACVIHQDLETGEKVINLITSKAHHVSDGEFMMFVNLYASCGQWKEANRWRERMNESGIAKTAGGSTIEVDGKFYRFLAGDISMDQDLHSGSN
ncbi:hypothetical protein VitviT2T_004917 [Vitis vinifera]|uniref:Pentatricopeptide repeat-containing protein n=2 Tax=Vitis vinifera TaxID=29760 RepID=A0ABY9BR20_VITVI|nr:pentatricopeptide repeat-containing protein At3g29230 isoform X1 [Vitis vinifera]WJZ85377.1 hypothetical protein VitviT2T_004917 [Vitis vinifera]